MRQKSLETAALPCEQWREIVRRLAATSPVRTLCDVLSLPPSTYYYYYHSQGSDELALREVVETLAVEYPRYDSRRITAELRRRGWDINHKHMRVRDAGRKPAGPHATLLPDDEPTWVWCADLTSIRLPKHRTKEEF